MDLSELFDRNFGPNKVEAEPFNEWFDWRDEKGNSDGNLPEVDFQQLVSVQEVIFCIFTDYLDYTVS